MQWKMEDKMKHNCTCIQCRLWREHDHPRNRWDDDDRTGIRKADSFNGQRRNGDPLYWQADICKLSAIDFRPLISLPEGIRRYISWVLEQTHDWSAQCTAASYGLQWQQNFPIPRVIVILVFSAVSQNLSNALAQRSDIELFVVLHDQVEQIEYRQINNYQVTFFPYGSDLSYYGSFYLLLLMLWSVNCYKFNQILFIVRQLPIQPWAASWPIFPWLLLFTVMAAAELATASLRVKLAYRVQALVESWYVPRFKHVISCSPM